MKLVSVLEDITKRIFEEEELLDDSEEIDSSSGAKLKAPETIEDLREKSDRIDKLSKIKREQGSSIEKSIDFFEMKISIGDDETDIDLNNETPSKVNQRFLETIDSAVKNLLNSEEESATVKIAYQFIDTDVELNIEFSIDKEENITDIETNLQNFSPKSVRDLKKWWESFRWRSLE